jgi:hypothetical protein
VRVLFIYNISFILKFLNQYLLVGLPKNNFKLVTSYNFTSYCSSTELYQFSSSQSMTHLIFDLSLELDKTIFGGLNSYLGILTCGYLHLRMYHIYTITIPRRWRPMVKMLMMALTDMLVKC